MGWLEGLLTGFETRHHQIEEENLRAGEMARQRETNFYNALLNSNDAQARRMGAIASLEAMLPVTSRRKKGLSGFFSEIDQSPYAGAIDRYMNTMQNLPVTDQFGMPVYEGGAQPTILAAPTTAGMPATKPATEGGPPPKAPAYTQGIEGTMPELPVEPAVPGEVPTTQGIPGQMPNLPGQAPIPPLGPSPRIPPEIQGVPNLATRVPETQGVPGQMTDLPQSAPIGQGGPAPVGPPPAPAGLASAMGTTGKPTTQPPQTTGQMVSQQAMAARQAAVAGGASVVPGTTGPPVPKMAMQYPDVFSSPVDKQMRLDMAKQGAGLMGDYNAMLNFHLSQGMPIQQAQAAAMNDAMMLRYAKSGGMGLTVFGGIASTGQLSAEELAYVQQHYPEQAKNPNQIWRRIKSGKIPGAFEIVPVAGGLGSPEEIDTLLDGFIKEAGLAPNDPNVQSIVNQYRGELQIQAQQGNVGAAGVNRTIGQMQQALTNYKSPTLQRNAPLSETDRATVEGVVAAMQRDFNMGSQMLRGLNSKSLQNAVMASLMAKGLMPNKLDAATLGMAQTAEAVRDMTAQTLTIAQKIDALGFMGPIASRWREFMTTEFGSTNLSTNAKQYVAGYTDGAPGTAIGVGNPRAIQVYDKANPQSLADWVEQGLAAEGKPRTLTHEERQLLTQFQTQVQLLRTAAARAHGGARAAGSVMMMDHFDSVINPTGDLDGFIGNLRGLDSVMSIYTQAIEPGGLFPKPLTPVTLQPGGQLTRPAPPWDPGFDTIGKKPVGGPPAPGGGTPAPQQQLTGDQAMRGRLNPATGQTEMQPTLARKDKDGNVVIVWADTGQPVNPEKK